MKRLLWLLAAYARTRRLRLPDRAALQAHQARQLARFLPRLCARSAYFAPYAGLPLAQWPTMDKAHMVAHFDQMNTAGLRLAQAMDHALRAEQDRDFSPTLGGVAVGLSSGTSAQRCVFAVSPREQAQWAGVMLAKALPAGLFARERVALCLRADSRLYRAVRTPWLRFAYFDLFQPFDALQRDLLAYAPTVLVAPAQVLRRLALAQLAGLGLRRPRRVISAAEVLSEADKALISQAFGPVHEIYQATEGFLASSCERGVLHLNEEHVLIEPQWLDGAQRRFVPLVTDFSRLTQPIVRYRLDDVLVAGPPCGCGRVGRSIARIEGRCHDLLQLPDPQGRPLPLFGDLLSRALAQCLPWDAEHQLDQTGPCSLHLQADTDAARLAQAQAHLAQVLHGQGVDTARLQWRLSPAPLPFDPTVKRRRIRCLVPPAERVAA